MANELRVLVQLRRSVAGLGAMEAISSACLQRLNAFCNNNKPGSTTSASEDIERLERGVHIAIGYPGRILDLLRGGMWTRPVHADAIKLVLIDQTLQMDTQRQMDHEEAIRNLKEATEVYLAEFPMEPSEKTLMTTFEAVIHA